MLTSSGQTISIRRLIIATDFRDFAHLVANVDLPLVVLGFTVGCEIDFDFSVSTNVLKSLSRIVDCCIDFDFEVLKVSLDCFQIVVPLSLQVFARFALIYCELQL